MVSTILGIIIILCLVIIGGLNLYIKNQEIKEEKEKEILENTLSDYRKRNESIKDK
jgi:hypothetical protein